MMRKAIVLMTFLMALFTTINAQQTESVLIDEYDAEFTIEWMQLLYDRVEGESRNVPVAARIYAYAGVALYSALMPGMQETNSLRLNAFPELPMVEANAPYDWNAVVTGVMETVAESLLQPTSNLSTVSTMTGFNTAESNASVRAVRALAQRQYRDRLRVFSRDIVERSYQYGQQVGTTIIAWAAADGFIETREMTYEIPQGEGLWQPTTLGSTPMEPYWGSLRPFVLPEADHCLVPLDVPFEDDMNATLHMQALEVRDMSRVLTDEQREIAAFWDERVGESGTASGHWVYVENLLADYLDLSLDQAAQMYAMVGVAMGDSFISAWSSKYQSNLLRPETYIQTYIDPMWKPLRQTPPFPAYPSGHAVLGGAVAEVLTELFGPIAYEDRYGVQYGMRSRWYTSFEAAAYENALSRLYAGVHYRVDMENGLEQGRCVGQTVIDTLIQQ
jgi:hypothetical protein